MEVVAGSHSPKAEGESFFSPTLPQTSTGGRAVPLAQRWANYHAQATSSLWDCPAPPLSSWPGRVAPGLSPAVPPPMQPCGQRDPDALSSMSYRKVWKLSVYGTKSQLAVVNSQREGNLF
ncbi:unnamed protein product [Caretta caretta]